LARLRSYLLVTLVLGVLVGWAAAIDSGRLFDTWAFLHDVETDSGNIITADTLGTPSNLALTAPATGNEIDLSFNASNDAYATHYQIFRCNPGPCTPSSQISGSPFAEGSLGGSCSTPSGACSYSDSGLTGGTNYCYSVRTAYLIGLTTVWTSSAASGCKTALVPVTLRDLYLTSDATNVNTECNTAFNHLASTGTGLCKISSVTQQPFTSATWCTTGNVTVTAQANWTLTLALDTDNPFQSATLMAELKLGATTIATSSTVVILPGGSPASVTLTGSGPASPPQSGLLCLTITNQTVDSNANSGASHAAKIVMTADASKIHGPFDP
jgi:hypothetical protein